MMFSVQRTTGSSSSLFTHHSALLRPLQESCSSQGTLPIMYKKYANKKCEKQTGDSDLLGCCWNFFRLVNTGPSTSDTEEEMNDEEACKRQTFATLKAVLQFYQQSEVTEDRRTLYHMMTLHIFMNVQTWLVFLSFTSSCTSMWCTWWTACGTVLEPCSRTGLHSHLYCCETPPHTLQVALMSGVIKPFKTPSL